MATTTTTTTTVDVDAVDTDDQHHHDSDESTYGVTTVSAAVATAKISTPAADSDNGVFFPKWVVDVLTQPIFKGYKDCHNVAIRPNASAIDTVYNFDWRDGSDGTLWQGSEPDFMAKYPTYPSRVIGPKGISASDIINDKKRILEFKMNYFTHVAKQAIDPATQIGHDPSDKHRRIFLRTQADTRLFKERYPYLLTETGGVMNPQVANEAVWFEMRRKYDNPVYFAERLKEQQRDEVWLFQARLPVFREVYKGWDSQRHGQPYIQTSRIWIENVRKDGQVERRQETIEERNARVEIQKTTNKESKRYFYAIANEVPGPAVTQIDYADVYIWQSRRIEEAKKIIDDQEAKEKEKVPGQKQTRLE